MTIQEAKNYGKSNLLSSPSPVLDTEVLLQHITGFDKTHLLLNRDFSLTEKQEEAFREAVEKRKTGLPVAYITGHKEFFGLDFFVSPHVLIPKPDTELLVELALGSLSGISESFQESGLEVCDMCCGSGCVGISILRNFPGLNMTFADISDKALEIAEKNAERILANKDDCNLSFVLTNLFEKIPDKKFRMIVTNPPYVPHDQSLDLLTDGRSEPILALDGDVDQAGSFCGTNDGLSLIRRLIPQCFDHLEASGILIMETGEYNAEESALLFEKAGFTNVYIDRDLNGMLRDVSGTKPVLS